MKKKKPLPVAADTSVCTGMKSFWPKSGLFLLLLVLAACSAKGRAVRTMPPEDRQFLSEVRYLITRQETKQFKNTPPEERAKFIEEFWKVRDPDPTSEENEFRDEYYRRIDEANHLFHEGSAGWLTDRGRVHILLGAPERRDVFPSGYTFYSPPVEIWYYSQFPVIFVDYLREGIYKLEPTSVRNLSTINVAQMHRKPKGIEPSARLFAFSLSAQKIGPGEAKLRIEVPYRVTLLTLNEATKAYETQLKLSVRISDAAGKTILDKEELHPIAVSESMLTDLGKNAVLEFEFRLPAGRYSALVVLENSADKSQARKEIKIKL